MNKHLILAGSTLVIMFGITIATVSHHGSLKKVIGDEESLTMQLREEDATNQELTREFEEKKQLTEKQILTLRQQLTSQLEASANDNAAQAQHTEVGALREEAYQQALREYEQDNPRVINDERLAEFFGNPEQLIRRNMESRYLSLLHATGITSPRLEQLIDLLVQGQQDIGRLRKDWQQGLISESEFYQQIKPYQPQQILASVLTPAELKQFQLAQEQQSTDASLKKFEASLAQDAGFVDKDIREAMLTAFSKARRSDDLYMSPEIRRRDIENQVNATLKTIANIRQQLQEHLSEEDMATANRFLQQQEDMYIQLEQAMKSIRQ